jgi:hypothetical protein
MTITPTQADVVKALQAFLVQVTGLPVGQVIVGQQNRIASPPNQTYIVMTPIRMTRLGTNVDASADVKLSGSIAGNTLTVTDVVRGAIVRGTSLFGPGVAPRTIIGNFLEGNDGGVGKYQVTPNQEVAETTMSAGGKTMTQSAEIVVQLDFHSADYSSGDLAQQVSTSLRDQYGVSFFAALAPPLNGVVPLLADDPTQRPFLNDSQQVEYRWGIDCRLQVNQQIVTPAEYADAASIVLVDVDAAFPP